MIEQVGENSVAGVGVSLAAKTWDAVEVKRSVINERRTNAANLLSAGEPLEGAEGDNRASKSDGASSSSSESLGGGTGFMASSHTTS